MTESQACIVINLNLRQLLAFATYGMSISDLRCMCVLCLEVFLLMLRVFMRVEGSVSECIVSS